MLSASEHGFLQEVSLGLSASVSPSVMYTYVGHAIYTLLGLEPALVIPVCYLLHGEQPHQAPPTMPAGLQE